MNPTWTIYWEGDDVGWEGGYNKIKIYIILSGLVQEHNLFETRHSQLQGSLLNLSVSFLLYVLISLPGYCYLMGFFI